MPKKAKQPKERRGISLPHDFWQFMEKEREKLEDRSMSFMFERLVKREMTNSAHK